MINRYMLVCLLGLTSLTVAAQQPNNLTLTELWKEALKQYPSIHAYEANLRKTTNEEKLVRRQDLPDIQMQVQNTFGSQGLTGGAFFPLPGLYNSGGGVGNLSDPATNLFGSMIMNWQFFQFGKQKAAKEAASTLTQRASYQLEAEQLAIKGKLTRSYLEYLFNQHMEEWAKKSTERLEALFNVSESMAKAGLTPGADSLLIKASLKQTEAILDNRQAQKAESSVALAMWVNRPVSQLRITNDAFLVTAKTPLPVNHDYHPLLAVKQEEVNYEDKQIDLAVAAALPGISLLGGLQLRGGTSVPNGDLYNSWANSYDNAVGNYLIGLGLTWNLGDLLDAGVEKARYEEASRVRESEAETLALNLKSQQESSRQQLVRKLQQIKNAEEAFVAAQAAYDLFEKRYQSGLIPVSELLQIQDVVQTAEKTKIEAYYQYWLQQAELAKSVADFSIFQNTFK